MAAASESVSCDTVLQAITAAVSLDSDARVQAEAALQQWETNSTPGFVGSLITIVQQTEVKQEHVLRPSPSRSALRRGPNRPCPARRCPKTCGCSPQSSPKTRSVAAGAKPWARRSGFKCKVGGTTLA